MSSAPARECYGIDAPGIVRTLFGAGAALVVVGAACFVLAPPHPQSAVVHFLRDNGFVVGGCLLLAGCWMAVSSLWLKQRLLKQLLDEHRWSGDERVLDVGCGRGLATIGAARRLGSEGRAIGVDLWAERDLSGNAAAAAEQNAVIAGVAANVAFETGDARALPYPDASFDIVLSMTAIHNIPEVAGRRVAIDEIWRVTKPGGQILIFDIKYARGYAARLRKRGATVRLTGPLFLWGVPGWRLNASKNW